MARVELTPAFLIHRRAYKDNSLLLDFLTLDHGRIRLIGRGVRQAKANIQMFQHLRISYAGKGELKTLTHWEVEDVPRQIKGEALILCLYVNELITRLIHEHDPHPQIFELYQQFVTQMNDSDQQHQYWLLRIFENNLLSELGYGLDYAVDVDGDLIQTDKNYSYQPQLGFSQQADGKISGNLLNLLLSECLDTTPNKQQLKACRNLNRQRLNVLLGNKPLKSRELFFTKN
ncbi:MAG TPA: DNA repair protein RecO [Gammaproteobacteria bacterium]|jgi:DNA repair protein RecO (recombination protein O)|nr:DNA repair protein RecO [Gammaproteobacteria bacterium]HAE70810.1 DNA repair protein RecO [Gammaproteobacteria bacterium]HAE72580.1 DNA repair protein RecO [Gammaproteobacteria bacterium]HAG48131.1 DNA repair protein RecO [Gammaproteobacteria bacterium]HAN32970.1 DNA repair protein RecO [Gammaproteobacteria bacterium]